MYLAALLMQSHKERNLHSPMRDIHPNTLVPCNSRSCISRKGESSFKDPTLMIHLLGKEDSCSKDGQNKCDKISNCPVGYWPMLPDSTCYKDSAGKIQELVNTFDEAQQV